MKKAKRSPYQVKKMKLQVNIGYFNMLIKHEKS